MRDAHTDNICCPVTDIDMQAHTTTHTHTHMAYTLRVLCVVPCSNSKHRLHERSLPTTLEKEQNRKAEAAPMYDCDWPSKRPDLGKLRKTQKGQKTKKTAEALFVSYQNGPNSMNPQELRSWRNRGHWMSLKLINVVGVSLETIATFGLNKGNGETLHECTPY